MQFSFSERRKKVFFILLISSIFCFALSMMRIYRADSLGYLFLNWNLFLAAIPWLISSILILQREKSERLSNWKFVPIAGIWLLFLPNAPYILTDLFHLRHMGGVSLWYDVVLIVSFAWTGMSFGMISLLDMHRIMSSRYGSKGSRLIVTLVLFLSAFGIYLGRFQRWNSWDIISNPKSLFYEIGQTIFHPMEDPKAWGVTIVLGAFLNLSYWLVHFSKEPKQLTTD